MEAKHAEEKVMQLGKGVRGNFIIPLIVDGREVGAAYGKTAQESKRNAWLISDTFHCHGALVNALKEALPHLNGREALIVREALAKANA